MQVHRQLGHRQLFDALLILPYICFSLTIHKFPALFNHSIKVTELKMDRDK